MWIIMENQRGGNHKSQRSTVHNTRSIFHKRQRGLEELEVKSGTGGIKEVGDFQKNFKKNYKGHRIAVLINTEIDCLNPFINFLHDFTLIVIEMKWNMSMFGFLYVS